MTPALASNVTTWFTSRWHQGPRVFIAPTVHDLPLPAPADARGLYLRGDVHLVAQQPLDSLAQALAHEAVGHHGLRQWLGAEWPHFMRHIQNGARAGDAGLKHLQLHIRQTYVDDAGQYALSARQEADEIAAYAAEGLVCYTTGTIRPSNPWAKALQAAKGRVIREGLCVEGQVTKDELEGALFLAAKQMEGWPWQPVRQRIGRLRQAWGNIVGMRKFDPYKPPMSLAESEDLLRRDAQRIKDKDERGALWDIFVGLSGLIGLVVCVGLILYGFGQIFFGK